MTRNSRFLLFIVVVLATTLACYLVRARKQGNEIRALRVQLQQRQAEQPKEEATNLPVEVVSKSEPLRAQMPEVVLASNTSPQVQTLLPLSNALAVASAERDALVAQLQALKSELARTQALLPEAEDPSKA